VNVCKVCESRELPDLKLVVARAAQDLQSVGQ
jgi:hypothetical protein